MVRRAALAIWVAGEATIGNTCDMKIGPSRPLNVVERSVLELLLSADFDGVDALRAQAADVEVVGRCGCGCPSVDLDVAPSARLAVGLTSRLVPSELEILPVGEEPPGQVILFIDGGRLSYLEYVYFGDVPTDWPESRRLTPVPRT